MLEIFPIPIKIIELESFESNLINGVKELEYRGNNIHGYMSVDQQVLEQTLFSNVVKETLIHLKDYVSELNHYADDITIVSSWANKLNNQQSIHPHIHSNSYISGVIYFSSGSNLILRPPTIDNFFTISTEFKTPPKIVSISPKEGQLVLFPSKLIHNVESSNLERYSIAFNTWPKAFGYPTAEVKIK
jgi:uncharacterized protein (TIGR02466 family)